MSNPNLVVNGGFDTGFIDPWIVINSIHRIEYGVYYETGTQISGPDLPTSEEYSLFMDYFSVYPDSVEILQEIPSLQPGAIYTLEFAINIQNISNIDSLILIIYIGGTRYENDINLLSLELVVWHTFRFPIECGNDNNELSFEISGNSDDQFGIVILNIDAISLTLAESPCFSGKSIIRTKSITTGNIDDIPASDVYSNEHLVLNTLTNEFISIIYNAKTGKTKRYMLFKKGVFGDNKPTEDLYITSGHKMLIDGEIIKAGKVPEKKVRKLKKYDQLYTISTKEACPIWINGLDVMTYSKEDFIAYAERKRFTWKDNIPEKE